MQEPFNPNATALVFQHAEVVRQRLGTPDKDILVAELSFTDVWDQKLVLEVGQAWGTRFEEPIEVRGQAGPLADTFRWDDLQALGELTYRKLIGPEGRLVNFDAPVGAHFERCTFNSPGLVKGEVRKRTESEPGAW